MAFGIVQNANPDWRFLTHVKASSLSDLFRQRSRASSLGCVLGALVLTHEHQDHCRGADRFAKKFRLPWEFIATDNPL